eukprot:TRINITY_DN22177_c0_g1_i1.p1 TRINITY_DN22177_c0_g1~~TRINITY_DN22177_c0_g1_i1.p1  ORF type:complete len:215 (+),score=46.70 TRINITY_DN22177_c0_g1_i1:149-793(+)
MTETTGEEFDYSLKIVLIGEASCGKTSLLLRYTTQGFKPESKPTIGLDFKLKKLNITSKQGKNYSIQLKIWDTAGSERFRGLTSSFYRDAHGVMFVYDITEEKTFEQLESWLDEFSQHWESNDLSAGLSGIVVGNKIDLKEKKRISTDTLKSFGEKHQFSTLETSALSGEGVDEAFSKLVAEIISKIPKDSEGGDKVSQKKDLFSQPSSQSTCC